MDKKKYIFISHQVPNDDRCADTVLRALTHFSGDVIGGFSAQFMLREARANFYDALGDADWLIMLVSNRDLRYERPAMEAGMFLAKHSKDIPNPRRVICLHDSRWEPEFMLDQRDKVEMLPAT